MICPDMATMLTFFVTDANIGKVALQKSLKSAVDNSFNLISVDNDMSTNDTVMAFANGTSGGASIAGTSVGYKRFTGLLTELSKKLAAMIVSDGEGATKFIEFNIAGAKSTKDARAAAKSLSESMLVKTAFFGCDPNWGRFMVSLGASGITMKEEKVSISFNGVSVVRGGKASGKESETKRAMKKKHIRVDVGLGLGASSATAWTTDLTLKYVKINSAYRS